MVRSAGRRADLSERTYSHHRALCRGRSRRRLGARHWRAGCGVDGPAGHRRKSAGRQFDHRHGGVRQCEAGRAYHLPGNRGRPVVQSAIVRQSALRPREELRAGHHDGLDQQPAGGQRQGAVQNLQGDDRVREGQPRQAQLGHLGSGDAARPLSALDIVPGRRQHPGDPVQGRRGPGQSCRLHGRGRHHLHGIRSRGSADCGRHDQASGGRGRQALRLHAGPAVARRRGRRSWPSGLFRHVGAGRHAEADRAAAQRRVHQGDQHAAGADASTRIPRSSRSPTRPTSSARSPRPIGKPRRRCSRASASRRRPCRNRSETHGGHSRPVFRHSRATSIWSGRTRQWTRS